MDGYDAVLAVGVKHRIYSLSLFVLWRRLCRRSLYRIPGKGVDCNAKADRSGSCGCFNEIRLLCHGVRDPCHRSGGVFDLWSI